MNISHEQNMSGLLRSAAPLALILGFVASPAVAQDAAQATPPATPNVPPAAPAIPEDSAAQPADEPDIVVTGSLFRRTNTETPSPVTVLTADSLEKAGISNITDAVRSISADSAGSIGTGYQAGFSAGGAAVSLRGLGVSSTLVLIDGLRSANFPVSDDGHNSYVDLNSIPFSLVDRVEVLKDGASSTYGADAIGGVVNLILKKHFTGIEGQIEGGAAEHGDASYLHGQLTAGYGDYAAHGWNVYINGEYQRDGTVSNHDRGFPYNNQDLTSIGGIDNNAADQSLTVNTPTAYVTRINQTDLNNPLSGGTTPFSNQFTALGLQNCPNGTFTIAAGTGCRYNLTDMFRQIQPLQERYSFSGRASVRLSDAVEAYATVSYTRDFVRLSGAFPSVIRQTQPFGGSPAVASNNPGIVLPVWICPSGTNCADPATPGRTLNPNNPFAAAFASNPANGAARIYYMFGDIPAPNERTNKVIRGTLGFTGNFDGDWNWRVEAVAARDDITINQMGQINIAALSSVINTGAYNFVNPQQNSQAVRDMLAPGHVTPSHTTLYSLDASVTKELLQLPGGPLQLAVGGQIRREDLVNRNQNAALDTYGLTTSSSFGKHTVAAGYVELDAPILKIVELNLSGRYDHYSEGFGHFSPKVGVKVTPIPQLALRGTYSQGFRAPTFAESNPASQFAGFVSVTPPCGFQLAHGATGNTTTCNAAGNPYNLAYSVGRGMTGNPALRPETSRSFTAGIIAQPLRWLSLTADYYNVKKSNLVVGGPLAGDATAAYFGAANVAAATAAVAAIGQGYSVNTVDAVDPLFPNALPRLLILNVPFVNSDFAVTSGIDLSATATVPITDTIKFSSRIEATAIFKYDLHTSAGVQRYVGTLGPYDLSSGNGTPRWRGNWQNTIQAGRYSVTATAYYVGRIKEVATDQGNLSTSCDQNLYGTGDKFCFVNSFINVDLNGTVKVNDRFTFFVNVRNAFNARAPIAPAAYASAPNFLTSWHSAGLIGRQLRAGASFNF